jgi:hypothetical protein
MEGAVAWLVGQQADDGGFVGFSGESDAGATLDAIIALAAADRAGVDSADAIARAVAYLESGDVALVYLQTGVGQAAKLALGLAAVGQDPTGFAGLDPVSVIVNGVNPDTGLYGTGVFDHALAVLALVATGQEVPASAIEAFAAVQADNGGWAFDASTDPAMADSNTTAMSIQALVAAGEGDAETVANGLAYLETIWLDGGAAYSSLPDTLPDANSTALVIQARLAAGLDTPADVPVLASFQNASGAFHYNGADTSDNLFATNAAIPALALLPLPIVTSPSDATPTASPVAHHDLLAA